MPGLPMNDLHVHLGSYLVMVQWGHYEGEDLALLTVSSVDSLTGKVRGESASLDKETARRVAVALNGDAPPCSCRVCASGGPRIRP